MKTYVRAAGLMLAIFAIALTASAKKTGRTGYMSATVLSVDKHAEPSNYVGSPTDAPLQAEQHAYDIKIRVQCDQYTTRYESATDYLPNVFVANHNIDVRFDRHVVYVSIPFSDREVKMGIIGHSQLHTETCSTAS